MAETSSTNPHPLERICDWIEERQPPEITVSELYSAGPDVVGLTELEFREWINEGIQLQIFGLKSLASIVHRNTKITVPLELPENPPARSGY